MSYPILYAPNETAFTSNGIGVLSSAVSVTAKQALNGIFELEMMYPVTGVHFSEIADECIILAKPDPVSDLQPFRIYRITAPHSGIITVYARHIAYDLMGIPVSPFTASGVTLTMEALKANAVVDCPFNFYTDRNDQGMFAVAVPQSLWSTLGGSKGSVLGTFGGEYEFDGYNVHLRTQRGTNRGTSIRYGKNLTSLEQDRNCADCHTGVYPYWVGGDNSVIMLPEKVLHADGNYSHTKIIPLDLSNEFDAAPTEEQLREHATEYMVNNSIGVPAVSWKVEFVQLEQTVEYKGKALLERVLLGDTVYVEFPKMNVSASARAVEYEFDSILERYNSVTLGSVRSNIADTIVSQKKEIAAKPGVSQLQNAVGRATANILGASGGAVRLLDTDGDGTPDTLYIADNADPAQAVQVWRFNHEGWGASKNGYNGPFTMGATLSAGMIADFITAGTLDANLIKAGVLQSLDGNFRFNLETGEIFVGGYATSDAVDQIKSQAESAQSGVDANAANLAAMRDSMLNIQTQSDALNIQINQIAPNGVVTEVVTTTGHRFDAEGMHISKSGEELSSTVTHEGFYVDRTDDNVLTANADGVNALNLTVRKYLVAGEHLRIEKYSDGSDGKRVGFFWLPG